MVTMKQANDVPLTTSAGDSALAAVIDLTTLEAEAQDRARPGEAPVTDAGRSLVDEELVMLRKRARARELAVASMAGALNMLRRANRALSDENALLRQQLTELKERAAADRRPHVRGLRSGGN
jgi:hypothetical protein